MVESSLIRHDIIVSCYSQNIGNSITLLVIQVDKLYDTKLCLPGGGVWQPVTTLVRGSYQRMKMQLNHVKFNILCFIICLLFIHPFIFCVRPFTFSFICPSIYLFLYSFIYVCSIFVLQEATESQDDNRKKLLEDNKKEDKEIKKLGKLLRLDKKKKIPNQFSTEGLDCILRMQTDIT